MKNQFYIFCLSQFWTLIYLLLFGHCVMQYLKEKIGVVSSYLLVLSTLILFVFGCVAACSAFAKLLKPELAKVVVPVKERTSSFGWRAFVEWAVYVCIVLLSKIARASLNAEK